MARLLLPLYFPVPLSHAHQAQSPCLSHRRHSHFQDVCRPAAGKCKGVQSQELSLPLLASSCSFEGCEWASSLLRSCSLHMARLLMTCRNAAEGQFPALLKVPPTCGIRPSRSWPSILWKGGNSVVMHGHNAGTSLIAPSAAASQASWVASSTSSTCEPGIARLVSNLEPLILPNP